MGAFKFSQESRIIAAFSRRAQQPNMVNGPKKPNKAAKENHGEKFQIVEKIIWRVRFFCVQYSVSSYSFQTYFEDQRLPAPHLIPKADCHIHANAMATSGDILRLANKYNVALPCLHVNADGSRSWDLDDHSSFHVAYDASVQLLREPEDIKDVAKSALIRASREGCVYAEILASGLNNCRSGDDPIPIFIKNMRALVGAIREAHAETGIYAFISLTAKRHLKDGPARAHQLLDAYEAFRESDPGDASSITGFNMAGNEEAAKIGIFRSVFERAHYRLNLGCASHAGEINQADDIRAAIDLPGVTRIGHGLSAINDPALMRELRERNILVEQLLTTNGTLHHKIFRSPQDHPIQRYVGEGLSIGLGSDDPGILGCSIGSEYQKAADKYGFAPETLLSFTANSVRHAFAPPDVKEKLLARLRDFAARNGLAMRPDNFKMAGADKAGIAAQADSRP